MRKNTLLSLGTKMGKDTTTSSCTHASHAINP